MVDKNSYAEAPALLHRHGNTAGQQLVRGEAGGTVNQMGIDVKKLQSVFRQNLLHAFAVKRLAGRRSHPEEQGTATFLPVDSRIPAAICRVACVQR